MIQMRVSFTKLGFAVFFVVLTVALGAAWHGGEAASRQKADLRYEVTINPASLSHMKITVSNVNQGSLHFQMLDDEAIRPAANLRNLVAVDSEGRKLPVSVSTQYFVVTNIGHSSKIQVDYDFPPKLGEYQATVWNRVYLWITKSAAYIITGSIFAVPDVSIGSAKVIFHKPADWTIGTTFVPVKGEKDTYTVLGKPTFRTELLRNVIRMAPLKDMTTKECDDITLTFYYFRPPSSGYEEFWFPAYGNTRHEQMEWYLDLSCKMIQYY